MPRIKRSVRLERIRTRFNHQVGRHQAEVYVGSDLPSNIKQKMIARRLRRAAVASVVVLMGSASIGIFAIRRSILRALAGRLL
jgi:hypothetical protein